MKSYGNGDAGVANSSLLNLTTGHNYGPAIHEG